MSKKTETPKRETQEQKIRRIMKEELQEVSLGHTLENCTFQGVKFDSAATDAISLIAERLIENAKGLGALSEVLKASNVSVECMVKLMACGETE